MGSEVVLGLLALGCEDRWRMVGDAIPVKGCWCLQFLFLFCRLAIFQPRLARKREFVTAAAKNIGTENPYIHLPFPRKSFYALDPLENLCTER